MDSVRILLNYVPGPEHRRRLEAAAPEATFAVATTEQEARGAIVDAEVVLGNRHFLQALPHATRLRWMQSNSMGVDLILRGAGGRLDGVTLTSARGVYADEVADHALALLLGVTRGVRDAVEAYGERRWGRWSLATLAGRRALVLGWGAIGRAIGRRLVGFGVTPVGIRRNGPPEPATDAEGFLVYGPATWRAELPTTDLLMIALPLTPETERCVGAAELASLPADAVVVNVGRGPVIDQPALFAALRAGRLRGAGLDTIVDEPPAPDDPAWDVPRLLLTPHVGRSLEEGEPRWARLFEENLRRWVAGEPLLNAVDRTAGY
jgi:phosphoglycerate dehydrogenase-like enzyme